VLDSAVSPGRGLNKPKGGRRTNGKDILFTIGFIVYVAVTVTLLAADHYMNREVVPQDFRQVENEELEESWGYELKHQRHGHAWLREQADVFRVRERWVARGFVEQFELAPEDGGLRARIVLHGGGNWSLPQSYAIAPDAYEQIRIPAQAEEFAGGPYEIIFVKAGEEAYALVRAQPLGYFEAGTLDLRTFTGQVNWSAPPGAYAPGEPDWIYYYD